MKLGIVVVTYNRSDVTNLMLDSLVRSQNKTPWRLILVDNSSNQDEFERIESVSNYIKQVHGAEIQIIQNKSNLGFSKGNNVGLKILLQDKTISHICLLNNDVIVTDFWIDRLCSASNNALVGPVSNSVGNEQIVPTNYQEVGYSGYTRSNCNYFAQQWYQNRSNILIDTKMLGFFCVVGEKSLFERVGYLDEDYGLGYYEDDDYCYRVEKAGFTLKIVWGVFIHHWGSASFSRKNNLAETLMAHNRLLFTKKHGFDPNIRHIKDRLIRSLQIESKNVLNHEPFTEKEIELTYRKLFEKDYYKDAVPLTGGLISAFYDFFVRHLQKHKSSWFFRQLSHLAGALIPSNSEAPTRKDYIAFLVWDTLPLRLLFTALGKIIFYTQTLWLRFQSNRQRIFVFPVMPYASRKQRSQHLAESMACLGKDVIWLDPCTGKRNRVISRKKIGNGSLTVLRLADIDYTNFFQSGLKTSQSRKILSQTKPFFSKNSVFFISATFWIPLIKHLSQYAVNFDCMDFHSDFGSSTLEIAQLEQSLFSNKNVKFSASSNYLYNHIKEYAPNATVTIVRNAVNPNDWQLTSKQLEQSQSYVGYFGAIAEWFDFEVLSDLATNYPETVFEIVGDTVIANKEQIKKMPENIKFLGERPYQELKTIASKWQFGLIPFKITPLIKATNPVKLYEYAALGLRVITTPIPEVIESKYPELIIYQKGHPIPDLKFATNANLTAELLEFAQKNSWQSRAQLLIKNL